MSVWLGSSNVTRKGSPPLRPCRVAGQEQLLGAGWHPSRQDAYGEAARCHLPGEGIENASKTGIFCQQASK